MDEHMNQAANEMPGDPNVKTEADIADPAERAKANGFVDPEPPSREERVAAVVAQLEHAMHHNSPIAILTLAEVKDLLGVGEPAAEEQIDPETDDQSRERAAFAE